MLGGMVVRRWAVAVGVTPRGLVAGGALGAVVLSGIGAVLAGRVPERRDDLLALGLVVAVWALAAGFGILVAHATEVPPSLGFLRTLPVRRRSVAAAAVLPLAIAGIAATLVVGPPALDAVVAASARPAGCSGLVLILTVIAGVAVGMTLHGLAGRLTAGTAASPLRLTLAVLAWFGLVGVALAAPLPLLARFGDAGGAWALAPLGWSLPWLGLVEPRGTATVGAAGVAFVLVAAAFFTPPAPAATAIDLHVRPLRLDGRLPLVRVQALRVVRHPRTLEALVVAGATAVALVAGAAWARNRVPGALDLQVVALLGAQVTTAPAALARGLSDHRRPAEAALGIEPLPHLSALTTGALVAVAVTAAPGVALAAALLSPAVAAAWIVALVPLTATAVTVSVALGPELGNGSAEAGAVLAAAALTTALLALAGALPGPVLPAAGPALTLAALAAAAALERSHRRPT
ncbi:MAG: hypothetical protein JNK12_17990 [Acidimicrobiales bacterium]|nr:hypothetical protein [Acidimicrobiales bacterium]